MSIPYTRFSPLVVLNCSSTGATACTCGISFSRSAILIGIGAAVMPRKKEAPGGCTIISAPTPSTRFADSFSIPEVMPTTSNTMPTSIATARMLTIVRMGRCRTLATIILPTIRLSWPPDRAQVDQLRVLRLFQSKLRVGNRLVKPRLENRNGERIVFRGAIDDDFRGVMDVGEILVV